jgi:hypothetical protein
MPVYNVTPLIFNVKAYNSYVTLDIAYYLGLSLSSLAMSLHLLTQLVNKD